MNNFRLILVAFFFPVLFAACQSSGIGTSNFTGEDLVGKSSTRHSATQRSTYRRSAYQRSSTRRVNSRRKPFVNEAASSVVKRPTVSRKYRSRVRSKVASRGKKRSRSSKGSRKRYARLVAKHARANGVPVKLALAVVQVESNYKSRARGAAGEIGLMQLMPRTARYIGYKGSMKKLYNPDTNLRYGMKYLGKAYRLGKGSTCGTILKYNAGHGAKRMNSISRKYCKRVRRIMRKG